MMHKLSKLIGREGEVAYLYRSGLSPEKIARQLGCGRTAVNTALKSAGVELRNKRESGILAMADITLSEPERKRREKNQYDSWVGRNRGRLSEYQAQWRAVHQEEIKIYRQEYGKNNRKALSDNKREWRRLNPQKFKAEKARRRALEKSAVGVISEQEWADRLAVYDGRCAYCLVVLVEITQDHVVPLSRGGSHTIDNVVPACRSCNSKKKDGDAMIPFAVDHIRQ